MFIEFIWGKQHLEGTGEFSIFLPPNMDAVAVHSRFRLGTAETPNIGIALFQRVNVVGTFPIFNFCIYLRFWMLQVLFFGNEKYVQGEYDGREQSQ